MEGGKATKNLDKNGRLHSKSDEAHKYRMHIYCLLKWMVLVGTTRL